MSGSWRMLNVMMIGRRVKIKVVRCFIIPLKDEIRLSNIPKSQFLPSRKHTTTTMSNICLCIQLLFILRVRQTYR